MAVRPQSLDILSICTGGGGLDLGIELAVPGARSVCMVEREAFAVAHLVAAMEQGLLAPAPVWSDARTFDGRRWRGCVDGLIGGIPCQPHSLAGRKQGQLDERDLWSDARRIIVQSRCWFVLIENVGGMLSAGADEVAGAERVWRDLRKLGFAVEIGLFTAAEVGASHERERVFILGVANDAFGRWGGQSTARGSDGSSGAVGRRGVHVGSPSVGLADAYYERSQGRRDSHDPVRRQGTERHAGLGGGELAVADGSGQSGIGISNGGRSGNARGLHARRDIDGCDCAVVDAAIVGRREGWPEPSFRGGRGTSAGAGHLFPPGPSDLSSWAGVLASAPEFEPAFRRVADGLASRLDVGRVDRLRMLGNGVVPLQAAHAFRTLCHRLAGRGSAGAAKLMGMMEVAE